MDKTSERVESFEVNVSLFVSLVPCSVSVEESYVACEGVMLAGVWPPASGQTSLAEVGTNANQGSAYLVFGDGIGGGHTGSGGNASNGFATNCTDGFGNFTAVVGVEGLYAAAADEVNKCSCGVGGVCAAYWVDAKPVGSEVVDDEDVLVLCDAFCVVCSCVAVVSGDFVAEVLGSLNS